ncbi:SusC/RagA family TonB-linked outer membrane protein [Bacteroides sp. BFG-257]|uniref:SusC/RagA family TonB-linked outer membrane protein n=1 Tax=Bacteroides sp. BFG-257 TaxID=2972761 RepID=UPI0021617FC8|nr:SusC/RagA family TonB-linked outer membrane protein [Bacteroides sp. BFG-257]UVO99436.1 SusC/RagA family TonB-linked outer membrane protein [Bacteroides sp. BFG-257]
MKEIKKRKWFILTKHSTRITAICISLLVIGAFSEQVYSKDNLVNKATNITDGIRQEAKRNITGQVKDNMGESLIGVTVQIKGEVGGTITDIDGKFTIKANIGDKLVVSYIGYTPQEIMIDNREHFSIVLNEDVNELQEVVVVGYGTQKRLNVTGSVSSVSSNQLKQSPVANISNALAGRLPGIISVQRGGEPGNDGANIWIRGFGTYGTANSPLIMVDGLERSYDNIDPNEIEDITILKDASSTAVYGVRGANGVILITTKRGTAEKPQISVNLQTAIQQPTRLPKYLDSYDALTLYREGLVNDGLNAAMYTDEYLAKYRDNSNPTYKYLYPNVNWQDEMLKPSSMMHQANININGKNSFVRYFVSVSYMQQNGLYNYEDATEDYNIQATLNRYNFRSNVDLSISKNLEMEVNLGGIIRDRNYPNVDTGDLWNRLKITPPWWYPVQNPDGSAAGVQGLARNPYAMLTQQGYRKNFETTLQATAGFTWKLPWVTLD